MKIIGMVFVFVSISYSGFHISEIYLSVLKDIKRADTLLKNMILGIESENMTLKEIFDLCIKNGDEKTKSFLEKIVPGNYEHASETASSTEFCRNKDVCNILDEVFLILGKYSAMEQIREIEICRNKIKAYYDKNEDKFREKAKLSKYSGILAGFFAVILFI